MVTVPGQEDVRGVGPRRVGPAANASVELLSGPNVERATAQLAARLDQQAEQSRLEAEVAQEQAERTQLLKAETDLRFEAFDLFEQVSQEPDNTTLASRFEEALSSRIEERVGLLPERSQEAGRQRFELVRRTMGLSALNVQRERLLTEAQQNLDDSLGGFQVQAFRNPESLDSARAATAAIIQSEGEAIGMTAEAIRKEIESNDIALIENALRGSSASEAEARLKVGEFDDALPAEDLIRLSKEFELAANRERAVAANRLRAMRDDHLASMETTGEGIPGFRDQMAVVLDEAEFQAFLAVEDTAIRIHNAAIAFPQQTEAQIAQTVESFRPVPGSPTFADEQRIHQALAKEGVRVLTERADDPAKSAMLLPEVSAEMQEAQQADDPSAFRRALRVRMDVQADLGVSPIGQRVTTKAEALGLVDQIRSAEVDEQAGAMLSLQETYGRFFPQLMQELSAAGLDSRFQVLAVVADHPVTSREIANVIAAGSTELAKGLDKAAVKDAKAAVVQALAPFSQAFTAGDLTQASVAQMNEITSVVQDLAVLNLRKGQSPDEAATNAADAIINSRFTVQDGLWIPNSIRGEPISGRKVSLLLDQRQTREAIEAFDPVPVFADSETPSLGPAVARDEDLKPAVDEAMRVFPRLQGQGFVVQRGAGEGQLEFFAPDEERNPNPGRPTIEIRNQALAGDALKSAILGDALHHLGSAAPVFDPEFRALKERFMASLPQREMEFARQRFQQHQERFPDDRRPFTEWFDQVWADALIRGLIAPDEAAEFVKAKDQFLTSEGATLIGQMKALLNQPIANMADFDVARERTIATAVNSGVWVTNETGAAAMLMIPDRSGGLHLLRDRSGNRHQADYLEASRTPMEVLRPERVPGRLTGPDASTLPGAILDPGERRKALEARQ